MTRSFGDDVRDFLLLVFGNSDVAARGTLLTNFSPDLASEVERHRAPLVDLQEIVSCAEKWGRLGNGAQAVEVLLENVRDRVRGLTREAELNALLTRFRKWLRQQQTGHLEIATDSSRSLEERRAAAVALAETIDPAIAPDIFTRLAEAFRSPGDDLVRYWLAIALGHVLRPDAEEVLTVPAGVEEHCLVRKGIREAIETIRLSQQ